MYLNIKVLPAHGERDCKLAGVAVRGGGLTLGSARFDRLDDAVHRALAAARGLGEREQRPKRIAAEEQSAGPEVLLNGAPQVHRAGRPLAC